MFKRLVATSRAPQIMVLSMLRSFGKIGPQIVQIWAWLSRGHQCPPPPPPPLKSHLLCSIVLEHLSLLLRAADV